MPIYRSLMLPLQFLFVAVGKLVKAWFATIAMAIGGTWLSYSLFGQGAQDLQWSTGFCFSVFLCHIWIYLAVWHLCFSRSIDWISLCFRALPWHNLQRSDGTSAERILDRQGTLYLIQMHFYQDSRWPAIFTLLVCKKHHVTRLRKSLVLKTAPRSARRATETPLPWNSRRPSSIPLCPCGLCAVSSL